MMLRPTLLLLHYFGGSGRSWDWLVAALGPGWQHRAPDLRGFGENHTPGSYTVASRADEAGDLADALDEYILVGHSMGGKVAIELAARRPPGLRGLILVAPSPPCPEPMDESDRETLRACFGVLEGGRAIARAICARAQDGPKFDKLVFARIVADHLRASRPAWDAWLDEGSREDITAQASLVSVPVLVVAAEQDTDLGPEAQSRLTLPRLSGARLERLDDSKHLIPMDRPDKLAALIARFCSDIGAITAC